MMHYYYFLVEMLILAHACYEICKEANTFSRDDEKLRSMGPNFVLLISCSNADAGTFEMKEETWLHN